MAGQQQNDQAMASAADAPGWHFWNTGPDDWHGRPKNSTDPGTYVHAGTRKEAIEKATQRRTP